MYKYHPPTPLGLGLFFFLNTLISLQLGNINAAIAKAAELANLGQYAIVDYPEKTDPFEELLKMFDTTTPEERLMMKVREFASKPRIMALTPEVTIQ